MIFGFAPMVLLGIALAADVSTGGDPSFSWIERGGIIGALFLGIVGFMREWWVPGTTYRRVEAERARLAALVEQVIPLMTRVGDKLSEKLPASRGR